MQYEPTKFLIVTSLLFIFVLPASAVYYGYVENKHGKWGRIGVLYNPGDQNIVEVYRQSPADLAGLKRGDIVIYVNDTDIAGPSYTNVNLTIRRDKEIFTVIIERIPASEIDVDHPLPHENKHKTKNSLLSRAHVRSQKP